MAGEQTEELPDELADWLADRAEATDRSRAELLARAVLGYRLADEGEYEAPDPGAVDDLAERLSSLEGRVDEGLASRLAELESDLDDGLSDVRDRVIQVLREAESKAPKDHDHAELADSVAAVDGTVTAHADRLDGLEERLAALEADDDELEATLADVSDKLSTLASATVRLQRRVGELEGTARQREAAAELRTEANRRGIGGADCEACGRSVRLGLLAAPRCPHCEEPFDGIEPATGFFGSATLSVGDRPALEGGTDGHDDPMDVFDDA